MISTYTEESLTESLEILAEQIYHIYQRNLPDPYMETQKAIEAAQQEILKILEPR